MKLCLYAPLVFKFYHKFTLRVRFIVGTCNLFQSMCQVFIYPGVIGLLLNYDWGNISRYLRNQGWKWAIKKKGHIPPNLTITLLKSAHVSVTLSRCSMDQGPLMCEGLLIRIGIGSGTTLTPIMVASFSIPPFVSVTFNPTLLVV